MNSQKNIKKKGFTIVEVSILFVIFLIVAFLVAPLSLDDTIQAKNTARWRSVQSDFTNIFYSVNTQKDAEDFNFDKVFRTIMDGEVKSEVEQYKITYMNGGFPEGIYKFPDLKLTYSNAVVAYNLYDSPKGDVIGVLMYDVNGSVGPNVWGKDIYGLNIYKDRFEPFCKHDSVAMQKRDCSRSGTGLCCSNYYLIGGNLN